MTRHRSPLILALDLATQTGWAAGKPCTTPSYGTINLQGQRPGIKFLQLVRELNGLIAEYSPVEIAIEEPFVGRKLTGKGLMTLFGFRAAAMLAAENKGIHVTMTTPASVRKHFLGDGGMKRADAKESVIAQCEAIGWRPQNDDEADARALWDFRAFSINRDHCNIGLFRV